MSPVTLAWLWAFLFTQAVEVPIYVAVLRARRFQEGVLPITGLAAQAAAAFGASLITHPIVWFVIPTLPFRSYEGMVAGAETFAVVAEALYFHVLGVLPPRWAFVWSLVANASSASLGMLSRHYFGVP